MSVIGIPALIGMDPPYKKEPVAIRRNWLLKIVDSNNISKNDSLCPSFEKKVVTKQPLIKNVSFQASV
uniref:Uncharacterized protein n=1 Tax=Pithovirus LCPAC304 TaxID=2506594 RepID=A0A481Z9P0_9VIRU|nr:MAG: hypothetical protein LCPAC304_04190 [Pithovirus LCPAC304]